MGIQAEQIPEEYAGYIPTILEQLDISGCEGLKHMPLVNGWVDQVRNLFFKRRQVLLNLHCDDRFLHRLIMELSWEKPPEHQTHDEQGNPTLGTVKIFPNQLYRELLKKYAA